MKIDIIGPKEDIIEKVGDILLSSRSLAGNMVVFPGKRPAHFLRKYLAAKAGHAVAAPRIFSMDNFVEFAAAELGIGGKAAGSLDLAAILYERMLADVCKVIGRKAPELTLDAFLPWAFKLINDFEEIKIELKTAKDLAKYDEILPEELRTPAFLEKFSGFSGLYQEFYGQAEKSGLLTRAQRYAMTAERIGRFGSGAYENIIFAGFFALTNAEKAILKSLAAGGNFRLILQDGPGIKEQFSFLGELPARKTAKDKAAELHFYKASDTHGEIFKLAELIKARAAGEGGVVVLPDPQALFPLVQNVLPEAGEYNISMGYPVVYTPVYALIDSLAGLMDKRNGKKYFAPDYLKFVLHPYVKNVYFKRAGAGSKAAEPTRVIFQSVEEALSSRMDKYIEMAEIENDADMLAAAGAKLKAYGAPATADAIKAQLELVHKTLITPFEGIKDIEDFGGKLLDFLSFISEHSTASLHPHWAPFMETVLESVIELKNCRLNSRHFDGIPAYFKFFRAFIKGAGYPFPGTPLKGLQVLGFLETRNLKFDTVYFLDANSDVLPSARKEDTILSHFIREGLGLSTYKTREMVSRYYFDTLMAGARQAHIFYKDSADKERSPFVEKLVWDLESSGARPAGQDISFKIKFSQKDPEAIVKSRELLAALKAGEFSPSAIDAYLNCGLRFYYQYALRLSEKDDVSEGIEQRDIGIIVHDILRDFFELKKGKPLKIEKTDGALMAEKARQIFRASMKEHGMGYEYLVKSQIEKRLADVLAFHEGALAGATVLECEKELKAELQTRHGKIKLKGRADRVDMRGGLVHILDYKTGVTAKVPNWQKFDLGMREDWPRTLRSVQLPFYLMAYAHEHGTAFSTMDASLMLLGLEEIKEETLFKERYKKNPDKAALMGVYQDAIKTLIEEILDIDLPFSPTAEESNCSNCPFTTLCGRQWTLA